ncbi:MAG: ABC transporter ATP-binding protein [Bacteroidia bacterium]
MDILKIEDLGKTYHSGNRTMNVLHDVSFTLGSGDSISIVGPSGSGKTTLLGLCAGLDRITTGTVELNGLLLNDMNEDERAAVRNKYVGFIFQSFQLIPTLTALENVMVPMELQGKRNSAAFSRELLERVGLGERLRHYPSQLSGGEQQRVSIARAFSNRPIILFADEPTGNLDDETGGRIQDLIFQLNQESGTTLVLVTHDFELARRTHRIIKLKGGGVVSDEPVESL